MFYYFYLNPVFKPYSKRNRVKIYFENRTIIFLLLCRIVVKLESFKLIVTLGRNSFRGMDGDTKLQALRQLHLTT